MGVQFQELWMWIRRRKIFASLLVFLTLGVGILLGILVSARAVPTHAQTTGAALLAVPDPISLSGAFAAISKNLSPAVVNISTTQVIEKPKTGKTPRSPQADPFGDFFDRFFDSPSDA